MYLFLSLFFLYLFAILFSKEEGRFLIPIYRFSKNCHTVRIERLANPMVAMLREWFVKK